MAPEKRKRAVSEESEPAPSPSQAYMSILRAMGAEENADFLTDECERRVLEAAATAYGYGNTAPALPSATIRQQQVDSARERGGIVNPDFRVRGTGEWRWPDAYDRHVAFTSRRARPINFGGQIKYNLGDHPSAESIWNLRQELRERGRTDLTHDIDLIFVPEEPVSEALNTPAAQQPQDPADEASQEPEYDLKNFGLSDQTGTPGKVEHHAVWYRGGWRVMDRSRATQNLPEPHMLKCYGRSGWLKWAQSAMMDWSDKAMIGKLNNWRDQTLRRGPFEQKRDQTCRCCYTPEQRQWVVDEYRKAVGQRKPADGMAKLLERFNARFSANRSREGLQSLWDRCRYEIDRFGELQPRRARGQHQKQNAAKGSKFELVTIGQQEEVEGKARAKSGAEDNIERDGSEQEDSERDSNDLG